jgi:hypothetical protein
MWLCNQLHQIQGVQRRWGNMPDHVYRVAMLLMTLALVILAIAGLH